MTSERIGLAAGAIWKKLFEKGNGGIPFSDLKKVTGFTADELLAGLGWLAREGKIHFREIQKKVVVSLIEAEVQSYF